MPQQIASIRWRQLPSSSDLQQDSWIRREKSILVADRFPANGFSVHQKPEVPRVSVTDPAGHASQNKIRQPKADVPYSSSLRCR